MNFQGGHLWVLLAFVALSFLQWLIRRLQEQSAINRKKQEAARRQTELLRTGRDPDRESTRTSPASEATSSDAAARQARLRELRQKQLEEMRRKNQRRPAPGQQTVEVRVPPRSPTQAPARRTPAVGATLPPPQRQQRPPTRPAQPPRQTATSRPPQRPPQRTASQPSVPRARPSGSEAPPPPRRDRAPAPPPGIRDTTTPRSLAPTPHHSEEPAPAPVATRVVGIGGDMTPADWRRAIILSEVLAPPVAFRDEL